MISNYLTHAARLFVRQKAFTLINIIGLSIGLAACLLIGLYVQHEVSYDRFHHNSDRIYRVVSTLHMESGPSARAVTPPSLGLVLHEELPEIEKTLRISRSQRVLSSTEKVFFDITLLTADSTFFDLFNFELIHGNPITALGEPNTIVVTEDLAKRHFGTSDVLGKAMFLSDTIHLTITGVLRDIPENSHLNFDAIYSRTTIVKPFEEAKDDWFYNSFYTYILLRNLSNPQQIERKLPEILDKYMGVDRKKEMWYEFFLQPVTDIHLKSSLRSEFGINSSMQTLYTFVIIGILILMLACFNFMNLSTAKASKRSTEVGLRKTIGAQRIQLLIQFLSEGMVYVVIAGLIALIIMQLGLPSFNAMIGRNLSIDVSSQWYFVALLIGILMVIGIASGIYPAFILSSFKPIQVLRGQSSLSNGSLLRKSLVVAQFFISIVLICGVLVIHRQMRFIGSQDLGFSKEQLIIVPIHEPQSETRLELIKAKLKENPSVTDVTVSTEPLGRTQSSIVTLPAGWDPSQRTSVTSIIGDADFLRTHEIQLIEGRDFIAGSNDDKDHGFIVNESAVRFFGWRSNKEAIGKEILWDNFKRGRVIGVVKDFHYYSLHKEVAPATIQIFPEWCTWFTVRISSSDGDGFAKILADLKNNWESLGIKAPFDFSFLDEDFDKQYTAELQLQQFTLSFSLLAIGIACLGLLGLAAFTAEQRQKEIAIRKVLGASVSTLSFLLSKDLLKLVVLANVFAWPIAWYYLSQWLEGFAYRIDMNIWLFIGAGLLTAFIAWATISLESIRAAIQNPINFLKG